MSPSKSTIRRRANRKAGLCADCGKVPSEAYRCAECEVKQQKHRNARRRRHKNIRLCRYCGDPVYGNTFLCKRHRDRHRKYAANYRQRCRDKHLCIQCGTPLSTEDIKAGVTSHFWKDCKPYRRSE